MQERRRTNRIRTNLHVRWETLQAQGRGSVCDLSPTGCFVLTGGEVSARELVRIEAIIDDEVNVAWGYVVYQISEMGFALRFASASADQRNAIERLVETAAQIAV